MVRTIDPALHEQRRQQILDAAERCFVRSGFRGASIAEICAEAHMSPGHLYHYFENKEAIIGAMTEAGLRHVADRVAGMALQEDVLQALLSELGKGKSKQEKAKSSIMRELVAEAGRNPAIATILRDHHRALCALLAQYLRAGQERGQVDAGLDAGLAAAVLLSLLEGASLLALKDPGIGKQQLQEMLSQLVARFLTPAVSQPRSAVRKTRHGKQKD